MEWIEEREHARGGPARPAPREDADDEPQVAVQRPVLVVEDERDLRETVSEVLEADGFRVLQASNGREALAVAGASDPCVIVLDLMMPVMTGWQVMSALEEEGRLDRTAVVIVSASHHPPDGARAFLPKPFGVDSLLETVERLAGECNRLS